MALSVRVACAVPPVAVGDVQRNVDAICGFITQAAHKNCRFLLFPELAITGYTCADLFFQQLLRQKAKASVKQIAEHSQQYPDLVVVVGLPLEIENKLYNCAAVIQCGRVMGVVPKQHLTDPRESAEDRWFANFDRLAVCSISAAEFGMEDADIPIGTNQVFDADGVKFGVEICEDLFVENSPSLTICGKGAKLILNPAASIQLVGKRRYRTELVREQSRLCGCIYAFCSAGCGESTRDSVYSGHSIIARNGELVVQNQQIVEDDYLLFADVEQSDLRENAVASEAPISKAKRIPFASDKEACLEMFAIQSAGLACRLKHLNAKAVVGVSGGLDSTLALLVAVEAMKRLGRSPCDVHAVTMPCFGTTDRTYRNALSMMRLLGVKVKEVDIRAAVLQHFADIDHDPAVHNATYENAQARERTQVLMDYAGAIGGIVVGTGDLSELALGWCTYNGDHMSMYAVNASIPKTVIPAIVRTVSDLPEYAAAREVLEDVIATPISPELLPADHKGKILQKTEDLVGPYILHDFFLFYGIKEGYAPEKLYQIACETFAGEFDPETIKKWMLLFYRRFFAQQFKRSCMPEGVKVTAFSLNPRNDWSMPSDAAVSLWLSEIEAL